MAVHLRASNNVEVSRDANFTDLLFRDLDDRQTVSTYTEHVSATQTIAASAGPVAIDLGGIVAGKFVALRADANLTVILGGETINVIIPATGQIGKLSTNASFTSLSFTNPSSSTAVTVTYVVVGTTT